MKKWWGTVLGAVFFTVGVSLFFYPTAATYHLERETENYIEQYETEIRHRESGCREDTDSAKEEDPLYQSFQRYNETLSGNSQRYFSDPWSCVQIPDELEGIMDECIGYIEIPAMAVRLPLYVGTSSQNMARGAAVLGQTSLPVGGENTNCVIAGHRGYRGAPYFREIERLKPGDEIIIHNPWETLRYMVESMAVIDPCDSEKVKIQPGRDMVTLLTCHPYRSGGKYRYVVYCVREDTETDSQKEEHTVCEVESTVPFVASEPDIRRESLVRNISAAVLFLMPAMLLWKKKKEKRHERKDSR